jgi:hypothetical protein
MRLTRHACSFALLLLFIPPVGEVSAHVGRPVQWALAPAARAVAAAGIAEPDSIVFRLDAQIDEGWNLYAPTQPAAGPFPMEVGIAAGWHPSPAGLVARRFRRFVAPFPCSPHEPPEGPPDLPERDDDSAAVRAG